MESTETKDVKTKRQLALDRLKAKYPEENFDDDEALFGRINGDYDDYDKQIADRDKRISGYEADEKALSDMFSADPRSAQFLDRWRKGDDPSIALIRLYGDDVMEIINDPEKQEAVAEANKEYAQRVTKSKEYEEEYKKNLDESLGMLENLRKEGMSDDEIDNVMEKVITIVRDGLRGKFTLDTFNMVKKAISHDSDVDEALAEGEIKGRNAKIDERAKLRRKGDGTAPLGGNGGGAEPRRGKDIGALGNFGGEDIWSRGGEKRIKH